MSEERDNFPYWDQTLLVDERVEDLIQRMTIEEKCGLMFQDMIVMGEDGALAPAQPHLHMISNEDIVHQRKMSYFNLLGPVTNARAAAKWHNNLQRVARSTRLGIPVTLSTDPRNHFTDNVGTGFKAGIFSQWPESLGFAATRSADLVEKFADIARQEYLAIGLRLALHPQVDLATEPRWSRIGATFGEDSSLTSELLTAYIRGFQGAALGSQSVSTMTKHFPGGGAQKDGEDPHFHYGREQVYPGDNWEGHLQPFRAAIKAGTGQIMPSYGMPVGTKYEEVGFAFNKEIMTGLLREELGFQGIICTDWAVLTDKSFFGEPMPARAWGVEHLSPEERLVKVLDAGCDQMGGESCPELLSGLVADGRVSVERIDESVRRLLREKFILGLFDSPFVDEDAAEQIVGNAEFVKLANETQRRSYTLLTNHRSVLPLTADAGKKFYLDGISPEVAQARGLNLVSDIEDADIALVRLKAPFTPRPGAFESLFHAGSLEYTEEEKARQAKIFEVVPTVIVDMYVDRPAVIPEIVQGASAIFFNYGATADAFLDVVFGVYKPQGKLPFDLPSSTEAVEQSRSDMPYDTKDPLFRFGHGLSYD
ncbi:hypothetical protein N7466_002680 [Penicillium verhagenii]|uniref:uncharacterized protein n=1 Tax=Penicillium verhagenii TaxID=1562060 RepID=UPI0025455D23|nr:uncharacterized protein N7466_002680 [Penicillium verhagenii]KAJ5939546.1 hypothetical protein N7466_002680 [Penicillium verhagenii]